ncbi:MAG: hypothetical protein ACYS1A_17400 [Planctomycetota bacterium]|jgi:hypothetical protein
MMAETKKCKMCRSDIADGAKKCPYCRSIQNWLFNPFVFAAALLLPYLIMILLFGMVFHDILGEGDPFENYRDALVISESKLTFGERNSGPTVVVVGAIQNQSDVNWEGIHLQVDCYNLENELFDTEQDSDYSLLVPAGAAIPFKVSFVREFPEAEYARHEVTAIHAEDEDRY